MLQDIGHALCHAAWAMDPGHWPQTRRGRGHGPGDFGARTQDPRPMRHVLSYGMSNVLQHVLFPMSPGHVLCRMALSHVLQTHNGALFTGGYVALFSVTMQVQNPRNPKCVSTRSRPNQHRQSAWKDALLCEREWYGEP